MFFISKVRTNDYCVIQKKQVNDVTSTPGKCTSFMGIDMTNSFNYFKVINTISPSNPACHLRDHMRNEKELFCVVSYSEMMNIIWYIQKKINWYDCE